LKSPDELRQTDFKQDRKINFDKRKIVPAKVAQKFDALMACLPWPQTTLVLLFCERIFFCTTKLSKLRLDVEFNNKT
jgi:hypothetical protein